MTEATPLASEQITQEDREAAATLVPLCFGASDLWKANVLAGYYDDGEVVQAFARHRIAALSASPAPSGQGVSGDREWFPHRDFTGDWMLPGNFREPYPMAEEIAELHKLAATFDCAEIWTPNAEAPRMSGPALARTFRRLAAILAAPAPSCAPGEVGALAWISGYAADFARNPDQPTNTIRNAFTAIERKAAAALSPQGLDAMEGGE